MKPDTSSPVRPGYMPELDAVRGLAILWVILHNAALHDIGSPQSTLMKIVDLIGNIGWVGVQWFFVLSGFLITGILLEGRGSPNQFRNFYMRRTLRIFPLYYVFLLIAFIILPWLGMTQWNRGTASEQLSYWTYLANWNMPFLPEMRFPHLWSLAVEEQFYLFWPLAVVFLGNRALTAVCLFLVLSALFVRTYLVLEFPPAFSNQAMYTFTAARWDSLAIGALLALAIRHHGALTRLRTLLPAAFAWLSLMLMAEIAVLREFSATGVAGIFNQTTIALWTAMLILLCLFPIHSRLSAVHTIFSTGFLRWFGKYSYAIYLFHMPAKMIWFSGLAVAVTHHAPWRQLGVAIYNFLGITFLATTAAWISWRILEYPFLRLKRYFTASASRP